jgi:hypothetical protein
MGWGEAQEPREPSWDEIRAASLRPRVATDLRARVRAVLGLHGRMSLDELDAAVDDLMTVIGDAA